MKTVKNTAVSHSRAIRLSYISIIVNLVLAGIKLAAGLWGHSNALVADAVHSASDVVSTIIVIVSLFISGKAADADHEYGHQKYESLAAFLLAELLAVVGIKMGIDALRSLITGAYRTAETPSALTAAAAALSILVKEIMYRITMRMANKERSSALKADAWHHRSDALSSVGSLIGVGFCLGNIPAGDPAASLLICVFILKSAADIGLDALRSLTDSACDKKTEAALRETILSVPGVSHTDMLRTRLFGSGFYVDVAISVPGALSLREAHDIARAVHDRIEKDFPEVLHCMVHVNPAEEAEHEK